MITPKSCAKGRQSLLRTRWPRSAGVPEPLHSPHWAPEGLAGGCSGPSPSPSPAHAQTAGPDGASKPAHMSPCAPCWVPRTLPVPLLRWRPLRGLGPGVGVLPHQHGDRPVSGPGVSRACPALGARSGGPVALLPSPKAGRGPGFWSRQAGRLSLRPSGASSGRAAGTAPAGFPAVFQAAGPAEPASISVSLPFVRFFHPRRPRPAMPARSGASPPPARLHPLVTC